MNKKYSGCSGLTSITIGNSVTSIGEGAFYGCTSLTSIVVDKDNAVYDSRDNCNAIIGTETNTLIFGCQNTVIPNSVMYIGYEAFYGCSGLTSVTIPNSVISIGDRAFSGCAGLASVTIPNSVISIGDRAFSGCAGLASIAVDKDNAVFDSRDNCNAIIGTETNTLIVGCRNTVIPNSVTSIGSSAFSGCTDLTGITIPNSVTSIRSSAFSGCTDLTGITIPNSVTSIGWDAFYGCSGLTSITIPNSVTSIGGCAFLGCINLTNITCLNSVPPTLEKYAFKNINPTAFLWVPDESVEAYKVSDWAEFFSEIVGIDIEAVDEVKIKQNTSTAPIFNLQGVQMKHTDNLPSGIYIQGGKKFVVK